MVHPGLVRVQIKSAEIEVDRGLEVFSVARPSDASFDCHVLAVDSLSDGVGNPAGAVAANVGQPLLDRPGDLLQRLETGVNYSLVPDANGGKSSCHGGTGPEFAEHLLVGQGNRIFLTGEKYRSE